MKNQFIGCVIVDDYGRILLLHTYNEDGSQWQLPGGEVDAEQLPETVAVRAVQEQLGVDARLVKNLGSEEIETDENDTLYHWFQASVTDGEPRLMGSLDFDDLDYFELEDMLSLALAPDMQVLIPKIASGEVALWSK
jgi:8-oxo-dGTP pyrophosphatase MutT (NUDIX family)